MTRLVNKTANRFLIYSYFTTSGRLSHKLPINSKKVADKSV